MTSSPPAAVPNGIAGVILRNPSSPSAAAATAWLKDIFPSHPNAVRTLWNAPGVVALTSLHVAACETGATSGVRALPTHGALTGIACGDQFGNLFGEREFNPVLERFSRSGPATLGKLNGHFCGFVWDQERRIAHFFRDESGTTVLYVTDLGDRIVFANDLRLLVAGGAPAVADEQAIAEFLHFLYISPPRSLLRNCHALLPGHVLTADGANLRQQRVFKTRWQFGRPLGDAAAIEREVEAQLPQFEEKLMDAVAGCLPASGRIAMTLSGGKDSSTIAVALAKLCPGRVVALTVGQSESELDESAHAALVAKHFGFEHRSFIPTDADLRRGTAEFAASQDQPMGDIAALPYFLGIQTLPEDCSVMLDGSGNDYYFGIVNTMRRNRYLKRRRAEARVPGFLWPAMVNAMRFGPRGLETLSRSWERPIEESMIPWEGWSHRELGELMGTRPDFSDTYMYQTMRRLDLDDVYQLQTENMAHLWEPNTGYRKAMRSGNHCGHLVRFPFTDARLGAFISGLPDELKLKNDVNKQLMRAYIRRNLPREIVDKPKSGFIFNLNRLFQNPAYRWAEELKRSGQLKLLQEWSNAPIDRLLENYARQPEDARWQHRLYGLCLLNAVARPLIGESASRVGPHAH